MHRQSLVKIPFGNFTPLSPFLVELPLKSLYFTHHVLLFRPDKEANVGPR